MGDRFADVALPLPIDGCFTYRIPPGMAETIQPGARVIVPFGNRQLTAYVVGLGHEPRVEKVKEIRELLDPVPLVDPRILELCAWISSYYFCPLGMVLRSALPAGLLRTGKRRTRARTRKVVRALSRNGAPDGALDRSPRQRACYEVLLGFESGLPLATLKRDFGFGPAVIEGLRSKGFVVLEDEEEVRPASGDTMGDFGEGWDLYSPGVEQAEAIQTIEKAIDQKEMRVFLLHGVSGSGKTVVYIEAIKKALALGRGAILLVPEIALTPQTVSRLSRAIDRPVALFHSALSEGERFDNWRRVRSGDLRVVVGARSAVFSPVCDLGLIVIDEEHEPSYKQEESPRYHAREVAIRRAEMTGSVVILGSSTPCLESYWKAGEGAYGYIELPSRYLSRPMPTVSIVDMREAPRLGETWFISRDLGERIARRLEKGEQTILFLNRRGHSTFLQCGLCGWVARCPQCEVSLTYHRYGESLVCHYCYHRESLPDGCPACRGAGLRFRGLGTEQVEEEIRKAFPGIRIARMDLDSTATRGSHRQILEKIHRREVDLLIGTQMVTKGLDFPGITLVGVISSDASLHFPDPRSSERTFQLLAQVAGRPGREGGGGEVILQTFIPESEVLDAVRRLDYTGFAREELRFRLEAAYPPYFSLTHIVTSGKKMDRVVETITQAAGWVRESVGAGEESGAAFVVGPAPCLVERVRGDYRWHFLLKTRHDLDPSPHIRRMKERFGEVAGHDITLHIDRDPISFV